VVSKEHLRRAIVVGLLLLTGILAGLHAWRGSNAPSAARLFLPSWELRVPDEPARTITLPGHFERQIPPTATHFDLHTVVPLPPELQGRELTLSIPFHGGIDALVVDGVPAVSQQDDLVRGYRSRGPHEFRLPHLSSARASVTLDLQVANTWTQAAWFDTLPRLHPSDERDGHTLYVRAADDVGAAFAIGLLLQLAWVYQTVFREGKRRRAYVFFAVQISAASYVHFFYLGFAQGLVGTYDVSLLALFIPGAAVASVYFTHSQFELAPPSPMWLRLLAVNVLVGVFAHGPFTATLWVGRTMVASLVVMFVYQLVTLGKLALGASPPPGVKIVLLCWIVLALGSIDDFPFWFGLGLPFGGAHGDIVALAIFATLQAANLAREHTASMQRGDELNAALAERVTTLELRDRENRDLNAELQRQIADRSRQLFAALSFVGAETAEATPRLAVGTRVQGRYRVVRELGEGGMGTVYEVRREQDGRQLALKVTRRTDGPSLARLAREAHVAASIVHPYVVGVVDVDIATDGYLYIVLEYVDGPTLGALRSRFGDVPWALRLLEQMAEGLQTLHDHGIVHRDFKPENVLVADHEGAPVARVTDFGISRLTLGTVSRPAPAMPDPRAISLAPVGGGYADASADTGVVTIVALDPPKRTTTPGILTEDGVLVGTPVYMAPELADPAHPLTPAADVFGLGMVAYEMLARELPFRAPPVLERLRGAPVLPATSLRRAGKGQDSAARARLGLLPVELVTMIDAALDLDPSVRPSAGAFAEAMKAARVVVVQQDAQNSASRERA
jgi:predicted Ser/Thr protein kinase